jgi:predicted transcriptional regulator
MFCYKESKLESDLDNLKSEIKKTDYEKTIEPYQKRIKELEKKVYILTQDMENLYSASKELIKSIDKDYLEVIINLDEPKAYFKKPELAVITVKRIVVPIKQDLLENYVYWINYYKSKYELGDDK